MKFYTLSKSILNQSTPFHIHRISVTLGLLAFKFPSLVS